MVQLPLPRALLLSSPTIVPATATAQALAQSRSSPHQGAVGVDDLAARGALRQLKGLGLAEWTGGDREDGAR